MDKLLKTCTNWCWPYTLCGWVKVTVGLALHPSCATNGTIPTHVPAHKLSEGNELPICSSEYSMRLVAIMQTNTFAFCYVTHTCIHSAVFKLSSFETCLVRRSPGSLYDCIGTHAANPERRTIVVSYAKFHWSHPNVAQRNCIYMYNRGTVAITISSIHRLICNVASWTGFGCKRLQITPRRDRQLNRRIV